MIQYHEKDWLETQLIEKERDVAEVAKDCGVQKATIQKWRKKLGVGQQYHCDFCEDIFPTKRGRNIHHKKNHGTSTGGFTYICESCGQDFESPRPPDDDKAPRFCGQSCYGSTMEGQENPNKNKERREKISQGLIKAYAEDRRQAGGRKPIYNEETEHQLDSSWEKEVDNLLHNSPYNYSYNGRGQAKKYSIGDHTHAPDFIVDLESGKDIVVEVKGSQVMYFQQDKMNNIAKALTERSNVIYIVIGDCSKIPCNYFIEYKNREKLTGILGSLVK